MKLILNIKSIIKFEQLVNKSFDEINFQSDDLYKLMYCIILENNDEKFTYDEFLELLNNKKIAKEVSTKFSKIWDISKQFSIKKEIEKETKTDEKADEKKVIFIQDIASILIVNAGLDANYVLNEMEIINIPIYLKALNNKINNEENILKLNLTYNRLNTWYNIIAQVGTDKINKPSKLYSFSWESEIEKEVEIKKQMTEDEFDEKMRMSAELMTKIKEKQTK